MIDIRLLRDNIEEVRIALSKKGFVLDVDRFHVLESKRKTLQADTQALQQKRNEVSKMIGMKKAKGENADALMDEMKIINDELAKNETVLATLLAELNAFYQSLPNLPHDTVPLGDSEKDNREERRVGDIPVFDFEPKSHDDIGEHYQQMDFAMGSKLTGARFVVLRQRIAKLHRALIQCMLDIHTTKHGYEEVYVPYIVNAHSLRGTGQLPKFEDDLFKLRGEEDYYLISTAEIPVTNFVRDELLSVNDLPKRWVCHTPCFRSEAGSYGRDTKGMIRQHQFEKVELVWVVHPDKSYEALETLTSHAEAILQTLKLPYRVITLCTKDMGANATKTYDIEVWLPSQHTYREISSCSNYESFQARRLQARFREEGSKESQFVHTLNGSGLAVGRTLVAILENYQEKDGRVRIPDALKVYMGEGDYV
jgi:seryl-tRNA synthetase